MVEAAHQVLPVNLEDEMRQSYLDYAMSVIVGRALPDVRDGLKPVHRRVLYAMRELGNEYNKAYKKSARVVGDVIGKYHPHGDTAVYDTIVRMAQPFSMRYMLVDGQGNFGSVDGDAPAAMRYTEVRMARIAGDILADIDKDTVDFVENYDGSESEPQVLPTRIPNLLVNGSTGIAVGMATNIPPHNLCEVIDAVFALLDDPEISIAGLMQKIPGPDFPTAGIINGAQGIHAAYKTGRGRVPMRARANIERLDSRGKEAIIVTELPYQVNKARVIEKIAELVREKRIEGITELRDESDKDGMRVVIELRRGEVSDVVLNNLYKQTQMESVFGVNMVALRDGQPRLLNLKEVLDAFIKHRREVVTRRTIFELRKARNRAHVLEGQTVALANIDEVIALIKAAASPAEAKAELIERIWKPGAVTEMLKKAGDVSARPDDLKGECGIIEAGYRLSPTQAQAILDLRLHRLTGLEQNKIINEYSKLLEFIKELSDILMDPDRLIAVIREELTEMREQYGDERRSEIIETHDDLTVEDLIPIEDLVVTISRGGYAKAQGLDSYQAQRRGGRGRAAAKVKGEDFIEKLFVANSHDSLLCFTSRGKVYWLKVYQLPRASRVARGRPMVNLLPLDPDERVNAVLPVRSFDADKYVFMATSSGTVKKTSLNAFSRPRANGIIAVDLRDEDRLVDVAITDGDSDILLFASSGKAARFPESRVRAMGRTAAGVRGIKLAEGHELIALLIIDTQSDGDNVLIATQNGFGKRTPLCDFPRHGRGGQGVIGIQTSDRNGRMVGAIQVSDNDEAMLISSGGTLVRMRVDGISVQSRNTQGVRLIRLGEDDRLVGLDRIMPMQDDGEQQNSEDE
ncbi:MAG: DNA gyrase subunit A [Gammaproteobacteria bacterium]|nr:DNA gyrase subunit A [Chromatiales bacterium]MDP6674706.1 DNA gyrase subunit A [Gammaproteobacteria bacterium]